MRLDRAFTPIRFASSHEVFSVNISILFYFLGHKPKGGLLLAELPWKDGKCRCSWANPQNELYVRYHDEEWGVPVHDDGRLFEMLILESFQAGLSTAFVWNLSAPLTKPSCTLCSRTRPLSETGANWKPPCAMRVFSGTFSRNAAAFLLIYGAGPTVRFSGNSALLLLPSPTRFPPT